MSKYLAIDYGTKRVGLAHSVSGIIATLPPLPNDDQLIANIINLTNDLRTDKIYIGISEGKTAKLTNIFLKRLQSMVELPIETVEEAVSTIEATKIYTQNKQPKKKYKQKIDSVAAAVILNRVINSG